MERTPARYARNEAVAHRGRVVGFALLERNLRRHRFLRRELCLAAERHDDCRRADGRVKALAQTDLRADLQTSHVRADRLLKGKVLERCGAVLTVAVLRLGSGDVRLGYLRYAVRVEESAAEVDNGVASPVHRQTRCFGDDRDGSRLEVLLRRVCNECVYVVFIENDSHSLL